MAPDPLPESQEVPWLIGHVVMATSGLEQQLSALVVALVHAPLAVEVVRGQRGNDSVNMARRLLRADQSRDEGEVPPLDSPPPSLPASLVESITRHLAAADSLLGRRDEVAHSLWLGVAPDDSGHVTVRVRRAGATENRWSTDALRDLYQGIVNVTVDLYTDGVNVRAARRSEWLWPERVQDLPPLPIWPS